VFVGKELPTYSASALAWPETLNFRKRVLASDEEVKLCERYAGKVGSYSSAVKPESRKLVEMMEAVL